jgi:hypothetical protein
MSDEDDETIILHVGLGKNLQDGIKAMYIDVKVPKDSNWNAKSGELLITNKRFIVMQITSKGIFGGKTEIDGASVSLAGLTRFEPVEQQGTSLIKLTGNGTTIMLTMNFSSMAAVASQVLGAVVAYNQSSSKTWLGQYQNEKATNSTNNLANHYLQKANNLKAMFYQLMIAITNN